MATGDEPTYAAVVLHYRDPAALRECLGALTDQTRPPLRVVVVDNGSTGDEVNDVITSFPAATVVTAPGNVGYGGGMRRGRDALDVDRTATLFVTQDCVLAPTAAAELLAALADDPRLGAVAPLLGRRTATDDIWSAGGTLSRDSMWTGHLREPRGSTPYDVTWADGAAILVREPLLDAVPWDEGYFLYFEDVELSRRLAAADWRVAVAPEARAWQEPGDLHVYLATRNHLRFVRRNGQWWNLVAALLRHLAYVAADIVRCASPRRRERLLRRVRGLSDAFTGRLRVEGAAVSPQRR